ncbi:MAG TPA: hypothetical protein VGS97_09665 [Actinocrinis sp.]|uniref:hypothetical protein n=1 Tax=Actinocrinis sp. TaxID=1920516 RepID=UPI002DDDBBC8|nr:hypothetical protein [Actinocrinis sp.]HEV2344347.1 hypothetical protein [Actinocrinis sp.]
MNQEAAVMRPDGDQPRNRSGRFVKTVESIDRDKQALQMVRHHVPYQEISDRLGYGGEQNVRRMIKNVLAETLRGDAEEVRLILSERLDTLARECWKVMLTDHFVVSNSGKIATHPVTGEPLKDDSVRLAAVDRLTRIIDQYAKLHGAHLPTTTRVELSQGDEINARIEALLSEMGIEEPTRQMLPGTVAGEVVSVAEED